MKTLVRYLHLTFRIATYSLIGSLEYRLQTIIRLVRVLAEILLILLVINSLFNTTKIVGSWTKESTLLTFGIFTVIWSTVYLLISDNLQDLGEDIRKGDLDGYLVKPVDNQFLLSCRKMHVQNIFRLLAGLAMIFHSIQAIHLVVTPVQWLLCLVAIGAGMIISYSLLLLMSTQAFWTDSSEIYTLADTTIGVSRYPLDIFPGKVVTLLTIIPVIFIATIPARILLGKFDTLTFLSPFIAAVTFLATRKFFFFALKRYQSASS